MKIRSTFLMLFLVVATYVFGQDKNVYSTTIIEFPFTWSNASDDGENLGGPVRFAPFFNFQNNLNIDFSEKAGFFAGLGMHNVGFIYDVDENTRKKVRSYNLGIPVGFKIGNMDKTYIYGGYELEIPFAYKEKTIVNEEKTKYSKWFSDQTGLQQSVLVGVQIADGANLKFKYYFTNFYKENYTESDGDGGTVKPYENFNANIFWISLNIVMFHNAEFSY
ncbi:MAG: hypothetical protein U5K79_15415 [Cyclobacteriaceae bacterium]|nr:hypothetical protein [Cyclobacteriaceae bacterium]